MTSLGVILGTRAETLKCVPVLLQLQNSSIDYHIILTSQNPVQDILDDFGVKHDDIIRLEAFKNVGYNTLKGVKQLPALIAEIRQVLRRLRCKWAIFHGDTATSVASALATSTCESIPIHIEAGLRSGSLLEPIPEELFRRVADRLSQILFAPSPRAVKNLRKERVKGKIMYTGNTITDLVSLSLGEIRINDEKSPYVVATTHRYENIFVRSKLKRIIEILSMPSLPVYWVVHPITEIQLKRLGLISQTLGQRIHLLHSLPYRQFIRLLNNCCYVITDGGSIEEECLVMKRPCVLLRKRTERGEGIPLGVTFITGLNIDRTKIIIQKLESESFTIKHYANPYALLGSPSSVILNYLKQLCN